MKNPKPKIHWEFKDFCEYLKNKKYKSSGEFKKKSYSVYLVASKKKLVDKIREHFGWIKNKYINYYSLQVSLEMAKKFKNFEAWKGSEHYIRTKRKKTVMNVMKWDELYTFQTCLNSIKKAKSPVKWHTKKRGYYDAAVKYGWIKKLYSLRGWSFKDRQTANKVFLAAFTCKTVKDLQKTNKAVYNRVKENGWAKSLFDKTTRVRREFAKVSLDNLSKMQTNEFPISINLKRQLDKTFITKAIFS